MRKSAFFLAVAMWFSISDSAFAYLDPGTGSILLQAVIGGVASGLFIVRIYWRKIKSLLMGAEPETDDQPSRGQRGK